MDNVGAAEVLVELLQISGREVRIAHDGVQALELPEAIRPEVVSPDVGMSGMNGFDVATTLRAKPQFESTIIVALTGWGAGGIESDRKRPVSIIMTKPAHFDDIETLLASLASAAGISPAMRPKALG